MNEDYLTYWGMSKPPFMLTPDPEMLYLSNQHSECLMRLKYAIFAHKGGALLVSDNAGNGKTSVLAKLKNDLSDYYSGRVKVVFISHPTITPIEMIGEIGHQLGTELYTHEKIRALNSLQDRLFSLYNENIKVIVIVDEGQMLKERHDLLDELRILLNFCVSDAFLLTFIFSGQKPLDTVLRGMPEFWQRLPVRYFLKNLDHSDTKAMIQYRLRKVGASEDIFNDDAFDGIYNYSKGCPRIICSVADLCLIVGFAKGVRRIGFVEVSIACRDMDSSGDGFHYYAYIKSKQYDLFSRQEIPPDLPLKKEPPVEKEPKNPVEPVHEEPVVRSVVCVKCGVENQRNLKFCSECGEPLYTKCPKCLTLVETVQTYCPVCRNDISAEKMRLLDDFRAIMKPFDVLEGWYRPWLETMNLDLEPNEFVLAIMPRGNFITPGPHVIPIKPSGKPKPENCDIVLTNKRFILWVGGGMISSSLNDVDTCMVSDSKTFTGHEYTLVLTIRGGMYRISLPYGARKTRKVMNTISTYVQSVMLK